MRSVVTTLICLIFLITAAGASEVPKGKIPADHLVDALTVLPWDVAVWDVDEAIQGLKAKDKTILWVDTRPTSFFKQGTVRDAVLQVYDKSGATYPDGEPVCTKDVLAEAMEAAKADMVVFFCQGPKCHRSYNAAYVAVSEWGLDPASVVWFRGGYPNLLKTVGETAKLKRKAARYLSDEGLEKL